MRTLLAEVNAALDAGYPPSLERIRALVERCQKLEDDLMACIAPAEVGGGIVNYTIDKLRERVKVLEQRHAQDVEAAFREGFAESYGGHWSPHFADGAWERSLARRKVGP